MAKKLGYGKIFRFWLPLAATWLMMAVEGPFLAAVIARLAAEKLNLAAYGVAYAFGLVAESPVIMLMSASTSLSRDRVGYLRLRNFSLALCVGVTLLLGLLLLPPVYRPVARVMLGLPPEIAAATYNALLWLLPWPAAIGIRRFYQGVLIAHHNTRQVAISTVIRVVGMGGCALLLYRYSSLPGAQIGTLALSTGVVCEAILTRLLATGTIRHVLRKLPKKEPLSYRGIWDYYLPLALTPFIGLSVHPMVTFFLGQSRQAIESLAVMPVLYGLTFIFRALGISYQEVAIALVGEERQHFRQVRNFAIGLGIATSLTLSLIAFTPLSMFWFRDLSGLSEQLSQFAIPPLQVMAIFPAMTVLICFQRAILISGKVTTPVSIATAIEAVGIFALLFLAVRYLPVSGAMAAALAYLFGRIIAISLMTRPLRQLLNRASQ